ncbi:hypothetical protein SpCBS45565_g03446 [Spizellomyces sp. 'palustris']|nr:hypothetical protein SpCBS45565_g03446 [Spizellomyces sp. 'palustris']
MGCGSSKNAKGAVVTTGVTVPAAHAATTVGAADATRAVPVDKGKTPVIGVQQASNDQVPAPATSTTAVKVAEASAPLNDKKDLSNQIANQVTASGDAKGKETSSSALAQSISAAISKQLSASENQLAKPDTAPKDKQTILKQLTASAEKLNKKGSSKSGSKASLASTRASQTIAQAISTGIAQQLSASAGEISDKPQQNAVAKSLQNVVASEHSGVKPDQVDVKSIQVTTEIHRGAGQPPMAHASVVAVSDVPVTKSASTQALHQHDKDKAKSHSSMASVKKAASVKSLKGEEGVIKKSNANLAQDVKKSHSNVVEKEDHISPAARKSLEQLNTELAEMKKGSSKHNVQKGASHSNLKGDEAAKSNQNLSEATHQNEAKKSTEQLNAELKKNPSQASLKKSDSRKSITVLIKKNGSRSSLLAESKKSHEHLANDEKEKSKDELSPGAKKSLGQLNDQLALERNLSREKVASVQLDGSQVKKEVKKSTENLKGSLNNLVHHDKKEHHVNAAAEHSLHELNKELVLEKQEHKSKEHLNQPEQVNADVVAVAVALVEGHKDEKSSLETESSEHHHRSLKDLAGEVKASLKNFVNPESSSVVVAPAVVPETQQPPLEKQDDHHRSVKELAADAKHSLQNLVGSKNKLNESEVNAHEPVATSEHTETIRHRSVNELAADVKHSLHNLVGREGKDPEPLVPANTDRIGGSKDQLNESAPLVPPSTSTVPDIPNNGLDNSEHHHRSIKELATDTKHSAQNLAHSHSKSKEPLIEPTVQPVEEISPVHEKESHHRSLKELASSAKQSLQNLVGSKSKEHLAEHPPADQVEPQVPTASRNDLTSQNTVDEHLKLSYQQQDQWEKNKSTPALNKSSSKRSLKEVASETKQSVKNLLHIGHKEVQPESVSTVTTTVAADGNVGVASVVSPEEVITVAAGENRAVYIPKETHEEDVESVAQRKRAERRASKTVQKAEIPQNTEQGPLRMITYSPSQQKLQDLDKEAAATPSLETHVEVDVSKQSPLEPEPQEKHGDHKKSIRDLANDAKKSIQNLMHIGSHHKTEEQQSVNVTGTVDVTPSEAVADPAVRQSADKLAKDVNKEIRASAHQLEKAVEKSSTANVHVSSTALNKAPIVGSTKDIAKDVVGHTETQAETQINAQKKSSRPTSPKEKTSRPSSPPKKATSRSSIPPAATSPKGSTAALNKNTSPKASSNALHKAPSTTVKNSKGSTATLNSGRPRSPPRRSNESLAKSHTSPKGSSQYITATASKGSTGSLTRSTNVKGSAPVLTHATKGSTHVLATTSAKGSTVAISQSTKSLVKGGETHKSAAGVATTSRGNLTNAASSPSVHQDGPVVMRTGSAGSRKGRTEHKSTERLRSESPSMRHILA